LRFLMPAFFLAFLLASGPVVLAGDTPAAPAGTVQLDESARARIMDQAKAFEARQEEFKGQVSGAQIRQPDKEGEFVEQLAPVLRQSKKDTASYEAPRRAYQQHQENREMQSMVKAYEDDVWAKLQQDFDIPSSRDELEEFVRDNATPGYYADTRLVVAVSSSMPEATIRRYVELLDGNPNAVVAIRGTIGPPTYIKPTMRWMQHILCGTTDFSVDRSRCRQVNVDLDPRFFQMFGIEKVPAVVYLPDPSVLRFDGKPRSKDFLVFYGDVDLQYIIERFQIALPGDPGLVHLAGWLKRGSFFNQDPARMVQ